MDITSTETTAATPMPEEGMILTQEAQYYLQQAAKWASFLAIMGFIGAGLMAIFAVFAGTLFTAMSALSGGPNPMAVMGPFLGIIYFAFAAIYFFINLFLYQFASKAKKSIGFMDSAMLTSSMAKLKTYMKIKGIILIVFLSLYLLIFIVAIVAGFGAASMMR